MAEAEVDSSAAVDEVVASANVRFSNCSPLSQFVSVVIASFICALPYSFNSSRKNWDLEIFELLDKFDDVECVMVFSFFFKALELQEDGDPLQGSEETATPKKKKKKKKKKAVVGDGPATPSDNNGTVNCEAENRD